MATKCYMFEFKNEEGIKTSFKVYIMKFGKVRYIGFEDIGDRISVTEASTQLALEVVSKYDLDPNDCLFFEWYTDKVDGHDIDPIVAEITYTWENEVPSLPKWNSFCTTSNNPFKM